MVGRMQDLAVVSVRAGAIKQTHLVPDNMTTLACLIPLGMRSLMTSRMIKDPMKVYSAAKRCKKIKPIRINCVLRGGSDLNLRGSGHTCIWTHLFLSVSALPGPWRRGWGRPSATPYITGTVWDESAEREEFLIEAWGHWDDENELRLQLAPSVMY